MKLLLICLCLFAFVPPVFGADLYEWTDARGVVHFSDHPQAVPASVRNSGLVKVRRNFFPALPTPTKPAEKSNPAGTAASTSNEIPSVTAEAAPQPPAQVIYAPQESTIVVVVNGQGHPAHRHQPCRGERCPPAFRPNFNDRQYVHPSVFSGGSRQYVRP